MTIIDTPFHDPNQPPAAELRFGDMLWHRREGAALQRMLVVGVAAGVISCRDERNQYYPIRVQDYERGRSDVKNNFTVGYDHGAAR